MPTELPRDGYLFSRTCTGDSRKIEVYGGRLCICDDGEEGEESLSGMSSSEHFGKCDVHHPANFIRFEAPRFFLMPLSVWPSSFTFAPTSFTLASTFSLFYFALPCAANTADPSSPFECTSISVASRTSRLTRPPRCAHGRRICLASAEIPWFGCTRAGATDSTVRDREVYCIKSAGAETCGETPSICIFGTAFRHET